jgi:hypothetical protein
MHRLLLAIIATCQSPPAYRVGCVYETAAVTAFVLAPSRAQCAQLKGPNVLAFAVLQSDERLLEERTRWIVPMAQLDTHVFGLAGYRLDPIRGGNTSGTVMYRLFAHGTFISGQVPLVAYSAGD